MKMKLMRTIATADDYELHYIGEEPNLSTYIRVKIIDYNGEPVIGEPVNISLTSNSKAYLGDTDPQNDTMFQTINENIYASYGLDAYDTDDISEHPEVGEEVQEARKVYFKENYATVNGTTDSNGEFSVKYNLKNVWWGLETITCNKKRVQIYIDGIAKIFGPKSTLYLHSDFGEYMVDGRTGATSLTTSYKEVATTVPFWQRATTTFMGFNANEAMYLVHNSGSIKGRVRTGSSNTTEYATGLFAKKIWGVEDYNAYW